MQESIRQRFDKAADKSGDCWLWMGAKDQRGYGFIHHDGKNRRAHCVSYELHSGPIPDGLFVCHACDNPSCVNPSHLFLGTAKDNYWDARRKGRIPVICGPDNRGALNGSAKITEASVQEIRKLRSGGMKLLSIAELFGISRTQVHNIVSLKKWAHIA